MLIAHGLHVASLAVVKLLLEDDQLTVEQVDVCVEVADIVADGVDNHALMLNLIVDDHQLLQPLLHTHLYFVATHFGLVTLLFDAPAFFLSLQALCGGRGHDGCVLACGLGRALFLLPRL